MSRYVGARGTSDPSKRRSLAQLSVSDEITPSTRAAARETMAGLSELMDRIRSNGSLPNSPRDFAIAIMNSLVVIPGGPLLSAHSRFRFKTLQFYKRPTNAGFLARARPEISRAGRR